MIPKIIHYCWFGNTPLPNYALECMESWKKYAPSFEIKRWDESNSPLNNSFVKAAYENKKWAFVADYIRFYALKNEGGIYLDTDMLLLKNIEELQKLDCFFGCETKQIVACGIIGSNKGNELIGKIVAHYEQAIFSVEKLIPITRIVTDHFLEMGFKEISRPLKLEKITLYPPEYFYPLPFPPPPKKRIEEFITPESYAVHLWEGSWLTDWDFFKLGDIEKGLKPILKKKKDQTLYKIFFQFYYIKNQLRQFKNKYFV